MNSRRVVVLSFLFLAIDLLSKHWIDHTTLKMPYEVIENVFYIEKTYNRGAAFSMFTGGTFLFIIVAFVALFFAFRYSVYDINHLIGFVGDSMLMGGILGNLINRLLYGNVLDFLSFRYGDFLFPIFNFADVFICLGIAFMILDNVRGVI